ncbi:MAG: hypothetical protein MI924_38500, partial [Chloroflexales bacterium]|nr:hypothetical protein [Chloroflexales bacterium]
MRNRDRRKESDQWEIPFAVLREAVANALVHRDYPRRDDGIYVEIFDNRIEITNPGIFPEGTSAETFIKAGALGIYTNPLIAEIFYLFGYVEQVGSGIRKMKNEMEQAGLQPPEFCQSRETQKFKVILQRPQLITASSHVYSSPPNTSPAFQTPYPPNPSFAGRTAELDALAAILLDPSAQTAALLPAITGLGGIGKTQLAAEFTHRYRERFPGGVFWLNMAQPETVAGQIAACAGPGGLDLPGWPALDFDARIAAVCKAWNEPTIRLLVFDNLEDPALLRTWRPAGGGTRVLLTSRRGVWSAVSGVQRIPLLPLERVASVRLLLAPRAQELEVELAHLLADADTAQAADAVCDAVGDLPLALALAGAYLERNPGVSVARYRARLDEQALVHSSLDAEMDEALPTDHATSVAATIALSYDQLDPAQATDGPALDLLARLAWCAPAPIPDRLTVRLAGGDPDDEEAGELIDPLVRRLS